VGRVHRLWAALVVVGLGTVASAIVVGESLRPEPGANMVLMGLPCIALPTAVAAAAAVGVVVTGPEGLSRWERRAGWAAGGLALVAFRTLAILG
jgi:hypothetical protein